MYASEIEFYQKKLRDIKNPEVKEELIGELYNGQLANRKSN